MDRPVQSRINTQIYEEASEWFIDCRAGDLDEAARAEFDRWLRKSPEHQSAYLEMAAIWNEGPILDPTHRWSVEALIAQASTDCANVIALDRGSRPGPRQPAPGPRPTQAVQPTQANLPSTTVQSVSMADSGRPVRSPARRRLLAVAACILVIGGWLTYLRTPQVLFETALGEQRSFALKDGSTIQLNSLSRVRIRYTDQQRTVELLQGQVLFNVAKDSTRPFTVLSGQTRIKAVGTQFDVYRKENDTVVTVVEGRVAVVPPPLSVDSPAPPENPQFLSAGEQIAVNPRVARRIANPNLAGAVAWTRRQLIFDSASLTDVATEFNRYNERKLVIDPSALGTLHISGIFSSTDPTSLIRFLRNRPELRVIETSREIKVESNR